jgi:NAD(P)H-hydrate epimerase
MALALKPRRRTSHKGQNGKVIVIGGSVDYVGAPAFVGMAAMAVIRSGADLVTVAAPEKVAWAINCISPDLMTLKLPGDWLKPAHLKTALALAKTADVVVIGNGIGLRPETQSFVKQFLKKSCVPVVIDADALKIVRLQDCCNAVLTPHGGEFGALLRNSKLKNATLKRIQAVLEENVLVLKGHPKTTIAGGKQVAYNVTGHAGMTHGGVGDVLAGIIAGLMAQGNDAFASAKTAAFINGKIGEKLGKTMGFGYLASDMVKEIPAVLKQFQRVR